MSVCNLNNKDIKSMINKILLRFRTKKIVSEYRETSEQIQNGLLIRYVKNNICFHKHFNRRDLTQDVYENTHIYDIYYKYKGQISHNY